MFCNRKNRIAGECSKFFAVTPLRFLLLLFRHPELVSGSYDKQGHEMLKQVQHDVLRVFAAVLIFFSNYSIAANFVLGDSLKNKYDINDPRNPNCPCHQYQKLADEEFAKLQGKEKDREIVLVNIGSNNPNVNSGKQNFSKNSFWFFHKKKRFTRKNQKTRGQRTMKRKLSDKLSRCFHF